MIGIDTNILVRYFMRDDRLQGAAAARLLNSLSSQQPGYLSLLVIVELWWVLRRIYKVSPVEIYALLWHFLDAEDLVLEKHDAVEAILRLAEEEGADIADCLIAHAATEAGCDRIVTFDRNAAKSAGMTLLASSSY